MVLNEGINNLLCLFLLVEVFKVCDMLGFLNFIMEISWQIQK